MADSDSTRLENAIRKALDVIERANARVIRAARVEQRITCTIREFTEGDLLAIRDHLLEALPPKPIQRSDLCGDCECRLFHPQPCSCNVDDKPPTQIITKYDQLKRIDASLYKLIADFEWIVAEEGDVVDVVMHPSEVRRMTLLEKATSSSDLKSTLLLKYHRRSDTSKSDA